MSNSSTNGEPLIVCDNLVKIYKMADLEIVALQGLDLFVEEGEMMALVGPSGSGKSTLMNILGGLDRPSAGQVTVDGLDVRREEDLEKIRLLVGMIFQNPDNQIISTTVEREIAFGLENLAYPQEQLRQRVEEILEQFHLVPFRHRPPHMPSGGEKQRLSIAAVLAMRPRYLILDEPTSLLDPLSRMEVRRLLKELRDREKVALVHITQFPEEALVADRLIVFHQGQIVMDGIPEKIFERIDKLRDIGLEPPIKTILQHLLSRPQWRKRILSRD